MPSAPEIPVGYKLTQKVLAYVIVEERLLVFRQPLSPEAGVQVPAGTIEAGEEPTAALRREIQEETGQNTFSIVKYLGQYYYDMTGYKNEIQERHVFVVEPLEALPETWTHLETNGGTMDAKDGIPFEFFWLPITEGATLIAGHGELLRMLADH